MNAVQLLCNVENFFDRNHNVFIRFGGLFALIFLTLYVPYDMQHRQTQKFEFQKKINAQLYTEIQHLNNQVEFLNLSYEKKKATLREVECLAQNIYYEAGSEPRNGKIAVAEVTMNRVKNKQFPRTVCGVVHQKTNNVCQFSWVCIGKKQAKNAAAWRESVKIAENILISKKKYGIIGNALYFHADYVDPAWADDKNLIAQIGNHIFYK